MDKLGSLLTSKGPLSATPLFGGCRNEEKSL